MWQRGISRLIGFIALYFALHGLMAILMEILMYNAYMEILVLFPAGKLVGDTVFVILRRSKLHSFWEEWLKETVTFITLSLLALLCAEFWKNILGLSQIPSLVPLVVILYLIIDWNRKGVRPQSELS